MENFKSMSQIASEVATRSTDYVQQLENIHVNEKLALMKAHIDEILFEAEQDMVAIVGLHKQRLHRRANQSKNTAQEEADAYFTTQNFRLAVDWAGQSITRTLSLPGA